MSRAHGFDGGEPVESGKLSCHILTRNSERYLPDILSALSEAVDDLVVVDSGSVDRTETIGREFDVRFVRRPFDDFSSQRTFALSLSRHRWVLVVDSDEVPDAELIGAIRSLKSSGFYVGGVAYDAYEIARHWFVNGVAVRSFFPVVSPDHPLRLFRKDRLDYRGSERVHDAPRGSTSIRTGRVSGSLRHYTCEDVGELDAKLALYPALHAKDLHSRGKRASCFHVVAAPPAAWVKWYLLKGGYRDGSLGWALGAYAFKYTYLKYRQLGELSRA